MEPDWQTSEGRFFFFFFLNGLDIIGYYTHGAWQRVSHCSVTDYETWDIGEFGFLSFFLFTVRIHGGFSRDTTIRALGFA